jgi:hypothetical protein
MIACGCNRFEILGGVPDWNGESGGRHSRTTGRKPFDMIFDPAKTGQWWGWGESNSRHAV